MRSSSPGRVRVDRPRGWANLTVFGGTVPSGAMQFDHEGRGNAMRPGLTGCCEMREPRTPRGSRPRPYGAGRRDLTELAEVRRRRYVTTPSSRVWSSADSRPAGKDSPAAVIRWTFPAALSP